MTAKELISNEIPVLLPTDNGNRALDIFENYFITNLALVDGTNFTGIISIDDIYNFDLYETEFKDFKKPLIRPYIFENQHIFDAIKALSVFKTMVLAVLDAKSNFLGVITQKSLIENLAKILCVQEEGYHLKFTLNYNDFSATEISNIVEKNDSKILSLYIDNNNSTEITVYLKIFTKDIEAVLHSFERYKYDITLMNKEQTDYTDFYQERLDNFLHYLKI